MATKYDEGFYSRIRDGARSSAEAVAPLVLEYLFPAPCQRVVDIGCGEGWWGHAFGEAGCTVLGVDGDYAEPVIPFTARDLERALDGLGTFDLAVCLEVAEHLSERRASTFISDLCALAPVVLFSAAIPGQGGTGHLNEQPPSYWVRLFAQNGFACSGALRWEIWDDDRVENWYRQNLIVAASSPETLGTLFDTPLATVWNVVHPILFDARRP